MAVTNGTAMRGLGGAAVSSDAMVTLMIYYAPTVGKRAISVAFVLPSVRPPVFCTNL